MPAIRSADMTLIDKLFGMQSGWVLDFTNRTISEFFQIELNIDIDRSEFAEDGPSKAKRVRCLLRKASVANAVRVLNALWEHRESLRAMDNSVDEVPNAHWQFSNLINRLEGKPLKPAPAPKPVVPVAPQAAMPDYAALLAELMGLQAIQPQPRGYAFEQFLKRLFDAHGLLARGGFRTTGEQIDGSFHLEGETYLVEAKWQNAPTPAADLHAFQGKLRNRPVWARGLFVSYSGFTEEGLIAYGPGGSVVCMDGLDLYEALNNKIPLDNVISLKARRSVETGKLLIRVRDLFPIG